MESSREQTKSYQDKIIRQLEALPDSLYTFSSFEDNMLRKYYPTKGGPAIAKILGKTLRQVKQRVQVLGIRRKKI
jgi:aromatic ring-opening dioxygenase catalytic subunit (LigB family)